MPQTAPPARRSAAEQTKLDAALTDLFESRICFNAVLGLKVVSLSPTRHSMSFAMRPELVGHYQYGRLHGGVISAALDATGGNAVMCALVDKHGHEDAHTAMQRFLKLGTIDLRIDYLRPGLGEHFLASARVIRLGGRVASVQMELHDEADLLIATGAGAYIVS